MDLLLKHVYKRCAKSSLSRSTKGSGQKEVRKLDESDKLDAYLIGMTNAGKSSLLNKLVGKYSGNKQTVCSE